MEKQKVVQGVIDGRVSLLIDEHVRNPTLILTYFSDPLDKYNNIMADAGIKQVSETCQTHQNNVSLFTFPPIKR